MMKQSLCNKMGLALMVLLVGADSVAWGPRAQQSVVSTAVRVVTQESSIRLVNLEADIQKGVAISTAELVELNPIASTDLLSAIESEMYLLQALRGKRVDPYFAYRLGVLGKLVAQVTAPLADVTMQYRNQYYADVDKNIDRVSLGTKARRQVDPSSYFQTVKQAASKRQALIEKDYQSGLGFNGVARTALAEDASRSVDAVADVWHTILTGSAVVANMSESQIRDYVVNALRFYIERGNKAETDATYARLDELGVQTPELRKRVGDMFYEAGDLERAVKEYMALLKDDPSRKDVAQKIAEYYVTVGDRALETRKLEEGKDAFAKAIEYDLLNESAHKKLMAAEKAIQERDTRMAASQEAIAQAQELEEQAEQEYRSSNFANAIDMLRQADGLYGSVSPEFLDLARSAGASRTGVGIRLRELRQELVTDSGALSGSGSRLNAQRLAETAAKGMAEQMLKKIIANQFTAQAETLNKDLLTQLQGNAAAQ